MSDVVIGQNLRDQLQKLLASHCICNRAIGHDGDCPISLEDEITNLFIEALEFLDEQQINSQDLERSTPGYSHAVIPASAVWEAIARLQPPTAGEGESV